MCVGDCAGNPRQRLKDPGRRASSALADSGAQRLCVELQPGVCIRDSLFGKYKLIAEILFSDSVVIVKLLKTSSLLLFTY